VLLIEEDEEASPTIYIKVYPGRLFKHDLEAIEREEKHISLNW